MSKREQLANRDKRLISMVINSLEPHFHDSLLEKVIALWELQLEGKALEECTDEIVLRAIDAVKRVIQCGDLRLKQVVFFMAIQMSEEWRACVCTSVPATDHFLQIVGEDNQKANTFFRQLKLILQPSGNRFFNPTDSREYTAPCDYMDAITLAYYGLLYAGGTPNPTAGAGKPTWSGTAMIQKAVADMKKSEKLAAEMRKNAGEAETDVGTHRLGKAVATAAASAGAGEGAGGEARMHDSSDEDDPMED